MGYDAERYQTKKIYPLEKATYAGALKGTTADKTATSAGLPDRIKFFNNIKLAGMKALPEVAPDAGAHVTSQAFKVTLTDGTTAFARTTLGTVDGVLVDGSVLSANIAGGKQLRLDMVITNLDGTVQTFAPGAVWVTLEYQDRF